MWIVFPANFQHSSTLFYQQQLDHSIYNKLTTKNVTISICKLLLNQSILSIKNDWLKKNHGNNS